MLKAWQNTYCYCKQRPVLVVLKAWQNTHCYCKQRPNHIHQASRWWTSSRLPANLWSFRRCHWYEANNDGRSGHHVSRFKRRITDSVQHQQATGSRDLVSARYGNVHATTFSNRTGLGVSKTTNKYDKINAFTLYFERMCITGSYPVRLWTHFDNGGPRTSNIAERWHNSLNHRFEMQHPVTPVRTELHELAIEVPIRDSVPPMRLNAWRSVEPRSAVYELSDNRTQNTKCDFGQSIWWIFAAPFTDALGYPVGLSLHARLKLLNAEILQYLGRVSHLLIGSS